MRRKNGKTIAVEKLRKGGGEKLDIYSFVQKTTNIIKSY